MQFDPGAAHRASHVADQHRDGLLATLSAHDLGFIDTDALIERLEATLTTIDRLEHFEGHLLNWYDTQTLAPLLPQYVSTVDSGNLPAALLALAAALRELARQQDDDDAGRARPRGSSARGARHARTSTRCTSGSSTTASATCSRSATGWPTVRRRAARSRRSTTCWRRRRGSPASSPSPRATCPSVHWFHLGRLITSVRGSPVLLSWSATMFEYLMPLLLMRSYPETLLDESCRMAVRRQIDYGVDARHAVGHLGVGLHRRRSRRQLSIQGVRRARARPEARPRRRAGRSRRTRRALAVLIDPARSARNLRRLADAGLFGDYGFFEAIDYTDRTGAAASAPPARRCARSSRITPACRWSRSPTRSPATA